MSIESKPALPDVVLTTDDRAPVAATTTRRHISPLAIATVGMLAVFAYFAFFFAPEDELQGAMQRIFYIHVPSAWVCFMAFFVTFCASIGYLSNRKESWDMVAASSAEIGTIFTTVVLVTGMMWGHAVWGVYWTWDPRLTSYLVLWLMYLAYIALRAYVPDPQRKARFSAVVAIIAFLDVPIVYLSTVWFRTVHPRVFTENGDNGLPPAMLVALMFGLFTFTLVFAYLVKLRLEVTSLQAQVEEIQS